MRLYHFINRKYGLQSIASRQIRISRINDLNDPFEFLAASGRDQQQRRAFRELKDELHKDQGIICFSERWRNPLMWSHYADKHRGICLGFDVPDHFVAQVQYSTKRLHYNQTDLHSTDQVSEANMTKCMLTKFGHWSYEREWRAFIGLDHSTKDERGNYFMGFNAVLCLKEVIVGSEANIARSELADAIGRGNYDYDLNCFKVRAAFRTFRVVKNRKKDLWQ